MITSKEKKNVIKIKEYTIISRKRSIFENKS